MRKIRLLTLFAFIILALLLMVGCDITTMDPNDPVVSIALKDFDPGTAIEMPAGDFDFGAYILVITYESGATQEVELTEGFIEPADRVKFYQVGDHDVKISYAKTTYTFKISVKRLIFEEISFPEENVFTYDGTAHTVEVEGNIPANATITYLGGNSFVNAGTYSVSAVISCEGYITAKLDTVVKVERAKHDMSEIKFEAKEVVYDGMAHSVEISGILPAGVTAPTYIIDGLGASSATDAGDYTVRAVFANKDPNFETIPDMVTTLKITPAEHSIEDVDIVFKRANGTVMDVAKKNYDGFAISFDLNDYAKLSKNTSVIFSVFDSEGKLISNSNQTTNIVKVGVYTVKAEFVLADSKNYNPVEPIVRTFEVLHTDYPIGNVSLSSDYFIYDGKAHSIAIEGLLPEEVSVCYEYYLGEALLVDAEGKPVQSVTDAGEYTVKAIFSITNTNYAPIPTLTAKLQIDKIKVDPATLGLLDDPSVEYSGSPYAPSLITWKELHGAEYDVLNYSAVKYYQLDESGQYVEMADGVIPTAVGSYRFVITVSIAEEHIANYVFYQGNTSQTYTIDFEIQKKVLINPSISFEGSTTYVYNGQPHAVSYKHADDLEHMTISAAYFKLEGDNYIKLAENNIPTDAGVYKLVVTATVDDAESYIFADDQPVSEAVFEYEIQPSPVEVPKVEFTYVKEVEYDGREYPVEFTYAPDSSLFTVSTAYYKLVGDNYVEMGEGELPRKAGSYRFVFTAEINDDNYAFKTNSDNRQTLEIYADYVIKQIVVKVPVCSLNIGESVEFDGEEQTINLNHNAKYDLVDMRLKHMVIKDGVAVETWSLLNVGDYQVVVTARLRDPENYVFDSGTTVEIITLPWQITTRKVEAPGVNITNTEDEIDYDGNKHPITYEGIANTQDYKVYTRYYKLEGDTYELMADNEVPKDAGKYKGVVVAELRDPNNCAFVISETELKANIEWVYEYEIKPIEIAVPTLTITQEARVRYSGEEQPLQFTSSVDSPYININYHYTKIENGVETDLNRPHPLDAGVYTCYITVSINDPNCKFAGETEYVQSSTFTYEIYKHVINIDELGWCTPKEYVSPDADNIREYDSSSPFCVLEGESYEDFKKYVKWSDYINLYYFDPYEGNYTFVDGIYERGPGVYEVTYTITVYNSSSCVLIHNSEEKATVTITVFFRIV